MKAEANLTVDNWRNIRTLSECKLEEILLDLAGHIDYYGVAEFKKQLSEYAKGERSSNISDAMCVTLGSIRSACEGYATLCELSNEENRAKRVA
jgi:hypothetical protein